MYPEYSSAYFESASEVTTIWRYTNVYIIIIIKPVNAVTFALLNPHNDKLHAYAKIQLQ